MARGRIFRRQTGTDQDENPIYSKTWYITVDIGSENGKRKQIQKAVGPKKADAEKELRTILNSIEHSGTYTKPVKKTVGQYLDEWLRDYAAVNLRPRTYQRYEGIVRNHLKPALGHILLNRLQPTDINTCYTNSRAGRLDGKPGNITAKTALQHHRMLSQALSHAVKWGLIPRNVAKLVESPRAANKEMRALDYAELDMLLEAARETEYYTLFHLAAYTGLRRSELLGLRWKDIDFNNSQIYINQTMQQLRGGEVQFFEPKTAKGKRSIYLTPMSKLVLKAYRETQEAIKEDFGTVLNEADLIFSDYKGEPLKPDTITRAFIRTARSTGLKGVRLHDLRHTHATLMLKQNVHPKIVQDRLGHATISITLDTYSHVLPGLQEAAALKFDEGFSSVDKTRDQMRPILKKCDQNVTNLPKNGVPRAGFEPAQP